MKVCLWFMYLWLICLTCAYCTHVNVTHAREGWEGRPKVCFLDPKDPNSLGSPKEVEDCKAWISEVKVPGGGGRCCGEGDSYIADGFKRTEKGFVAIITREYPHEDVDDGEGGTVRVPGAPIGTEIVIPNDKINEAYKDGNPTGHGIIFMGYQGDTGWTVYCYFGPTLS